LGERSRHLDAGKNGGIVKTASAAARAHPLPGNARVRICTFLTAVIDQANPSSNTSDSIFESAQREVGAVEQIFQLMEEIHE
jgi:hypothetical protein